MFFTSAVARTSARAPCSICATSTWLPSKSNETATSGLAASKAWQMAGIATCNEAAANTVSVTLSKSIQTEFKIGSAAFFVQGAQPSTPQRVTMTRSLGRRWFPIITLFGLTACSVVGQASHVRGQASLAHRTNIGGCKVLPKNDPWNTDISQYAVDPHSANYLAHMHAATDLHPDFGSNPTYGIPWITVPGSQAFLPISFDDPQESNPGPYPFPPNVPIENGDRHAIVIDTGTCTLYETYDTTYLGPPPSNGFHAYSGAVFSFAKRNPQRTDGWTSADAAGLAILPGLVKKSEADSGVIHHAFRFTMAHTQ